MARPNVLLFFTDQQRFDTIGALGNGVIRTPNLDRLCGRGTAFTSAYSPSPVCVPARASMLYGKYPHHSHCYENGDAMPLGDARSVMDLLSAAGYRTHGVGKCHFTPDAHALRGFSSRETQEEIVGDPDKDDYLRFLRTNGFDHITDPHGVRGEMYYVPQPAQMPASLHPTQWVGDRCTAFVERQQDSADPWFLFASFTHPHPPFCPPAPWHKLYRAPLMPLPKVPQQWETLLLNVNRHQNRYKYRDQGIDNNLVRCMKAYYYGCISFIDMQVGRMLDALDRTGQTDKTLILFMSDHGELLGDYNSFGKRSMHDSCARVPLLASLPGRFAEGAVCDTPVSLVDVLPTVAAATQLDTSADEPDGVDLADVARGDHDDRLIVSQLNKAGDAVYMALNRRWKYLYSAPDNRELLFDRVADPAETRNRASAPFVTGYATEMRTRLQQVLRDAGEDVALDGDRWREYPVKSMPLDPDAGLLVQDHPWANHRIEGYTAQTNT
ncbi:MAG: sulfatase-like hydrolase/transferase [Chitinivibrionales bacterium]|nr:sulfatase-like hydrolase/transferase [Chitinivibrionales bacterium]